MKILFTHRYFWPDTPPYAAMLRRIAEHFASAGHDVHVFASQPSYGSVEKAARREIAGKVNISRVSVLRENKGNPLTRAINLIIYCVALFIHILRQRADVVSAATFPPISAGWTASLAAKITGAKFVYHMQDVHPEVSKYSGGLLGKGILFRLLQRLDMQTLRRADAIIVLSQDMANTLEARHVGKPFPIHVINNFQLESFESGAEPPTGLLKPKGKRRIIFAGNLGKFQNLELLTEGISRCFAEHPELELLLMGDGEMKPLLEKKWRNNPQVRFGPFLPYFQAEPLIRESDIGLVSLSRDIYRVSYPSKVLTYIGLGLPMLALVEPESALAKEISDNGLGTVPDTATIEAISVSVSRLLAMPLARENVSRYHEQTKRVEIILAQWREMIADL